MKHDYEPWLLFSMTPPCDQAEIEALPCGNSPLFEVDPAGKVSQILCPPQTTDVAKDLLFDALITGLDHDQFAWDILHFCPATGTLSLPCDGEFSGDYYLRQAVRVGASIEMIVRMFQAYYGKAAIRWDANDICTHTMKQTV